MKRLLGLAVLIFGLSVPARAQSKPVGGVMGGISGGALSNAGGAGGYGGYGGGEGGPTFHTLPAIPPADLRSSAISGTNADFVPSSFLPYSQAIAVGQAILNAEHKSVAENSREGRIRAKAAIIENGAGDAVLVQE